MKNTVRLGFEAKLRKS